MTPLERLEEYSANHNESFDELGNWPAERFEDSWRAYQVRTALDRIDRERDTMIAALYSNGMLDPDGFRKEMLAIGRRHEDMRRAILDEGEEEVVDEFIAAPDLLKGMNNPGS